MAKFGLYNSVDNAGGSGDKSWLGLGEAWDNLGGLDKFKVGLGGLNTGLNLWNAFQQYGQNKFMKDYYSTSLRNAQEQNRLNTSLAAEDLLNKRTKQAWLSGKTYDPSADETYQALVNYGKTGNLNYNTTNTSTNARPYYSTTKEEDKLA